MIRYIIFILWLFPFTLAAQNEAGNDSVQSVTNEPAVIVQSNTVDTVLINSYAKRFDPRKALLYAAIVPGLGQVYTKKYWKIPLVYGGLGVLIWNIDRTNTIYRDLKSDLFYILNTGEPNGPNYPNFNEATVRRNIDNFRRDRDFYIIITGLVYILQIVDAHVDTHLKEFDLNPKLQVRLEPMMDNNPMIGRQAGFSVYLRF